MLGYIRHQNTLVVFKSILCTAASLLLTASTLLAQASLLQPAQALLPKTDTLILADGTLLPILLERFDKKNNIRVFKRLEGIPKYEYSNIAVGNRLRLNDSALQLARFANGHLDLLILNEKPTPVKFVFGSGNNYYFIINSNRVERMRTINSKYVSYYQRNFFKGKTPFSTQTAISTGCLSFSYGSALRFGGLNPTITDAEHANLH